MFDCPDPLRVAGLGRASSVARCAGDAPSCAVLGHLVDAGQGVPADRARALELFRKACAGGDERGCQEVQRLSGPNRMILAPPRW